MLADSRCTCVTLALQHSSWRLGCTPNSVDLSMQWIPSRTNLRCCRDAALCTAQCDRSVEQCSSMALAQALAKRKLRALEASKAQTGDLLLEVEVAGVTPRVWRRVRVSAIMPLCVFLDKVPPLCLCWHTCQDLACIGRKLSDAAGSSCGVPMKKPAQRFLSSLPHLRGASAFVSSRCCGPMATVCDQATVCRFSFH